jgi:hypothetical protein
MPHLRLEMAVRSSIRCRVYWSVSLVICLVPLAECLQCDVTNIAFIGVDKRREYENDTRLVHQSVTPLDDANEHRRKPLEDLRRVLIVTSLQIYCLGLSF